MTTDVVHQAADSAMKVTPPLAVSTFSVLGLPLESWVYIITIIYTVLQIALLIYKWKRSHKEYKEDKRGSIEPNDRD